MILPSLTRLAKIQFGSIYVMYWVFFLLWIDGYRLCDAQIIITKNPLNWTLNSFGELPFWALYSDRTFLDHHSARGHGFD